MFHQDFNIYMLMPSIWKCMWALQCLIFLIQ